MLLADHARKDFQEPALSLNTSRIVLPEIKLRYRDKEVRMHSASQGPIITEAVSTAYTLETKI